ncbi:MAG: hypothetical protein J7559_13090 [Cohnella sp.]|nr:hypothetical protein [Cohnella sp.]
MNPVKRDLLSRLMWLALCLVVLAVLNPVLFMRDREYVGEGDNPRVALLKNWEVRYGKEDAGAADSWRPFNEAEWRKLYGYKGELTVRRAMPEIGFDRPYLFMAGMNRFEVFLDGESVYRYRMDDEPLWNNYRIRVHPLKLNPQDEGKELTVRMIWDGHPFLSWEWMMMSDPDDVLSAWIRGEWPLYAIALFNLTVGVAAAILYAKRRVRTYLWFALLALAAGFGLLFVCQSLQWFVNVGSISYWNDLLLPFCFLAFIGMYAEALGVAKNFWIRLAKLALAAFIGVTMAVGIWDRFGYWTLFFKVFPFVGVAAIAVVTAVLFKRSSSARDDAGRRWLVRGYAVLTFCGLTHTIGINPPQFMQELMRAWPYSQYIIGGMLPNGLFLFMLCMVMVLVSNVRRVHQESERNAQELIVKNAELELFHRKLEQLVDVRTKELEVANLSLHETMREKAETLAEVSVLEERTRIAHEMHDVVGHTLTAAIVQLEATKRLAERDQAIPIDKLAVVNGLVRKGLEEIRKTVRMLKVDNAPFNLELALKELIRDTIEKMEVEVEERIELPSGLGKLAEQVLYHALQEGLTNGIRHARCSRFQFAVRPESGWLRFKLANDGIPFGDSKPGFGLTAMMERVQLLGGQMTIGSAMDEHGEPIGCELAIALPLSGGSKAPHIAV